MLSDLATRDDNGPTPCCVEPRSPSGEVLTPPSFPRRQLHVVDRKTGDHRAQFLRRLEHGTGRADTSTGEPVRGFRAIRVLRWRILNVPKPRTSMFFCACSASLIDVEKASTTRAQSFFEIIGPAVREIWAVTRSTRSALVIEMPRCADARGDGGDQTELIAVNSLCVKSLDHLSPQPARRGNGPFPGTRRTAAGRRAGRGRLRMVLDGKDRHVPVPQPLDRPVVQVHVGHLELRRAWDPGLRSPLDRESVILRRDQDAAGRELLHRVISAAVAVRHLDRVRAEGEAQDLMAEADPEDRHACVRDLAHRCRARSHRRRIAGTVREKDAVRLELRAPPRPWSSRARPSLGSRARRTGAGCCA